MTELKHCPFCGGEADISDEGIGTEPERYWAYCTNSSCFVEGTSVYATEQEAINAWNTRYKRTCKYVQPDPHDNPGVWNTGCGNHVYWNVDNDDCGTPPDYCPKCGSEVEHG